ALRAVVTGVGNEMLTWMPEADTRTWLSAQLFQRLEAEKITDSRLLARLTLHGNYIWAGELIYLDGETFGMLGPGNSLGIKLPSGDDRPGGDFRMWFWLRRLIKSVTVKPTLANSVAPGQPFGTVEVQLLEPAPIGGVKVEF